MKTKTNTESGLLSRSEQLSTAKAGLARINFAKRRVNRSLDTQTLLAVLRGSSPRFFGLAEVVGKWVWIQFAEKQSSEVTSVFCRHTLRLLPNGFGSGFTYRRGCVPGSFI